MEMEELLKRARAAKAAKLAEQQYIVHWRSGGEPITYAGPTGLKAIAASMQVSVHSLRCYLANGRGTAQRLGTNPSTGADDIMYVTKVPLPAKSKPKRGRPPLPATLARRAEAELAAQYRQELLPSAKRKKT